MSDKRTQERLDWLVANPEVWKRADDMGPRSDAKRIIFEQMQVAGLYSFTTNFFDTSVDLLVEKARQIIEVKAIKRPRRRKCAYCSRFGYLKDMVLIPAGRTYRSECHFAHRNCIP